MAAANRVFHVGPDDEPDRYRLLRQVGGGGEAELWKADMAFAGGREPVAVKILRARHTTEFERWRERWAEQAELLRLVRHPGVVGVHGQFAGAAMHLPGEADRGSAQALYLVMNWVEGQDLRDWVPAHTATADRAEGLRYLTQVADVLDWLHSGGGTPSGRPVIHGDISPANVIVNGDGQAVLVDFGLFRITGHVTALPAGTPGYCAPEVIAGGEYSAGSDRYAFGGLALYVLTGEHPPVERERLRSALRALAATVPPAGPTYELLARMFDPGPARRPSAGEWIRGLRLHTSTAPVRTTAAPARLLPPRRPVAARLDTRWAAVAAAAVLGAVVALAVAIPALSRGGGETPEGAGPTAAGTSVAAGSPAKSLAAPKSPSLAPSPVVVALVNLQPTTSDLVQGAWTLDDVTYEQSLGCSSCDLRSTAIYNVGGKYRTLTGVLATKADFSEAVLTVKTDNRDTVTRRALAEHPTPFQIDISGARKVTIELETFGCCTLTIIGQAAFVS
ncbi:protein kinase domain-containing protein [Dactylosporangium sp. CS-033363]|uniref:serine/threonine-protein kinase n=1 Tax=Dactylosporangium sp. CS-033363 TaxID=3239935 RepID=UPI003D8DB356